MLILVTITAVPIRCLNQTILMAGLVQVKPIVRTSVQMILLVKGGLPHVVAQVKRQRILVVRVPLTLAKLVIQHVLILVLHTAVPLMFTKVVQQLAQVWPIVRTNVAIV